MPRGSVEAMSQTRTEHDSMGDVEVPADALWRAQTQRAVDNFPISGTPLERRHVQALALVKGAAARVNGDLGVITAEQAAADRRRRRRGGGRRARRRTSRSTSSRPARAPAPT